MTSILKNRFATINPPVLEESSLNISYKMDNPKRGFALIVNNEFISTGPGAHSSKKDVFSLVETLKYLGFIVVNRKNLRVVDTRQIFTDISRMDHSNCDSFICFILTVGSHPTTIQCSDGTIALSDLLCVFRPNKCSTLIEKPKLFFIQTASPFVSSTNSTPFNIDHNHKVPMVFLSEDFLVSTCTTSTERRYSLYIETLCENLRLFGGEMDILQILTRVNYVTMNRCKANCFKIFFQVPSLNSTLTKQLIFTPVL
ncbi:caspase-3-like [Argonauta hians]